MGESIAVLIIFFIIVVIGFVFYMNVLNASSEIEKEENLQLKAIEIAQMASFLPELQCSQDNVRRENCIDLLKLEAAEGLIRKNNIYHMYYNDIFESSNISIEQKFPTNKRWILYENIPENYTNKISTFIPISIFDEKNEQYNFAILSVKVYK